MSVYGGMILFSMYSSFTVMGFGVCTQTTLVTSGAKGHDETIRTKFD